VLACPCPRCSLPPTAQHTAFEGSVACAPRLVSESAHLTGRRPP
jgi:hypothetical protein